MWHKRKKKIAVEVGLEHDSSGVVFTVSTILLTLLFWLAATLSSLLLQLLVDVGALLEAKFDEVNLPVLYLYSFLSVIRSFLNLEELAWMLSVKASLQNI